MSYLTLLLLLSSMLAKADELETRLPIETFLERSVGYVRQPALVDWRKKSIILTTEFGQAIEYNNFSNKSFGLSLRFPAETFTYKANFSKIQVAGTDAFFCDCTWR